MATWVGGGSLDSSRTAALIEKSQTTGKDDKTMIASQPNRDDEHPPRANLTLGFRISGFGFRISFITFHVSRITYHANRASSGAYSSHARPYGIRRSNRFPDATEACAE